eukprot:1931-Heterococcus_DN1.PRE.2
MHGALQRIRQLAQRLTAVMMCVCYTVRNALDGYYYCRPDDSEADTQLKMELTVQISLFELSMQQDMPHYGGPEGSIVGGEDLLPGSEAAKIAHVASGSTGGVTTVLGVAFHSAGLYHLRCIPTYTGPHYTVSC